MKDTLVEVDSRRMHFLIEEKSLLSSPGKMIGEQYRISVYVAIEKMTIY